MTTRKAATEALASVTSDVAAAGEKLLSEGGLLSWSVRVKDGESTFTVAFEQHGQALRSACTCGEDGCAHVAAVLTALAAADTARLEGGYAEKPARATPTPRDAGDAEEPATDSAPEPAPREEQRRSEVGRELTVELARAVDALVRATCANGLEAASVERDDALDSVLTLLKDRDMPDLRRAVAMLRRELTSPMPDPSLAGTALIRLSHEAEALRTRRGMSEDRGRRRLPEGSERREEMQLLEVARDSQRTPYGDRRDVSYFVDLEGGQLFREQAAAKPGQPPRMSEGPFPKLLMGNLVAVETGSPPRRIRMLQYSTAGLAGADQLRRIQESAATSVNTLYATYREALETHDATLDPVVIFAPDKTIPSSRGCVLTDAESRVLPLARSLEPTHCEAVDLLAREATIAAVVGPLVLGPTFLSILPLSVLLGDGASLSLRQLR